MHQDVVASVIATLLGNRSVTFAQLEYETDVPTAAAHAALTIRKRSVGNVQLYANIKAQTEVYADAVKRSAAKEGGNNPKDIASFQAQGNYFEHLDCYSIVKHKAREDLYLYARFFRADSEYTVEGKPATKEEVAQYLTPSERKKLLDPPKTQYNATYDIEHNVVIRTIKLENIISIRAVGGEVNF